MALIERDIVIGNGVEAVFNYAGMAEHLHEWYDGVSNVSSDGSWPGVGGQIALSYTVMGITLDLTATVTAYNPPYEFSFQLDGMIHASSRWIYQDEGGNTHVYAAFDYTLPGGILGQIADKMAFEQMLIQKGEQSLMNLKSIAEG